MVDDDIAVAPSPESIRTVGLTARQGLIAHAATDETHNHIVGIEHERMVLQTDAVARRRLSGNGQITFLYFQLALQFDDAAHGKHNGARPLLFHGPAERAFRTVVLQRVHHKHFAPGTTLGVTSGSAGTGKGGNLRTVGRIIFRQTDLRFVRSRRLFLFGFIGQCGFIARTSHACKHKSATQGDPCVFLHHRYIGLFGFCRKS